MICEYCEARSDRAEDNLHCVADGTAHRWHVCGDVKGQAPGSDCPSRRASVEGEL